MVAALILSLSRYQVLRQTRTGLANIYIICCTVHLWKMMPCTMLQLIKTFHEKQIHWTFPLYMLLSLVFGTCYHVSIRFLLLTLTLPVPLMFGSMFAMSLISGDVPYGDNHEHPLKIFVHCWTFFFFLLVWSAHFQIEYSYNQATPSFIFVFVCAPILGYAVRIFLYYTTDAKCVMCRISWHKSLKGSVTPASAYRSAYPDEPLCGTHCTDYVQHFFCWVDNASTHMQAHMHACMHLHMEDYSIMTTSIPSNVRERKVRLFHALDW